MILGFTDHICKECKKKISFKNLKKCERYVNVNKFIIFIIFFPYLSKEFHVIFVKSIFFIHNIICQKVTIKYLNKKYFKDHDVLLNSKFYISEGVLMIQKALLF